MFKNIHSVVSNHLFMMGILWRFSKSRYVFEFVKIIIESIQPFPNIIFPALIINQIVDQESISKIMLNLILLTMSNILIDAALSYINSKQFYYEAQFNFHVESIVVKKFMQLDLVDIEQPQLLDKYQMALNADVAFFFEDIRSIIIHFLRLVGTISIILTLNFSIVILVLFTSIISGLIEKRALKYVNDKEQEKSNIERHYNYYSKVATEYAYAKEVRINQLTTIIEKLLSKNRNKYLNLLNDFEKHSTKSQTAIEILNILQQGILYCLMIYYFVKKVISIGSFTAYLASIETFKAAFSNMVSSLNIAYFKGQRITMLRDFLKQNNTMQPQGMSVSETNDFLLEFRNVSFCYPNSTRYVLRNVSLKIQSGQKFSLVGVNGAGKSTFIKLLLRLYDPTEGQILLDDVDITKLDLCEYRKKFSIIFQDFKIFSFTIKENIAFDKSTYDDNKIQKTIEEVGLDKRIAQLKYGLQTYVFKNYENDGIEFSGGELQKIALARALVRSSNFLVFDEPTSAMDAIAESNFYKFIDDKLTGKTSIIVSHRISSPSCSDKIIVFDNGQIIESGTREELLKINGKFKELYDMQAQYYVD